MSKNRQPWSSMDVHFAMSANDDDAIPTGAYVRNPGDVEGIEYRYGVVKFGPVTFFGHTVALADALASAADKLLAAMSEPVTR